MRLRIIDIDGETQELLPILTALWPELQERMASGAAAAVPLAEAELPAEEAIREGRPGRGLCRACGHGSNSRHHKERCKGEKAEPEAPRPSDEKPLTVTEWPPTAKRQAEAPAPTVESPPPAAPSKRRCIRCNGTLIKDLEDGMACLQCGYRPPPPGSVVELSGAAGRRLRGPSRAGERL